MGKSIKGMMHSKILTAASFFLVVGVLFGLSFYHLLNELFSLFLSGFGIESKLMQNLAMVLLTGTILLVAKKPFTQYILKK